MKYQKRHVVLFTRVFRGIRGWLKIKRQKARNARALACDRYTAIERDERTCSRINPRNQSIVPPFSNSTACEGNNVLFLAVACMYVSLCVYVGSKTSNISRACRISLVYMVEVISRIDDFSRTVRVHGKWNFNDCRQSQSSAECNYCGNKRRGKKAIRLENHARIAQNCAILLNKLNDLMTYARTQTLLFFFLIRVHSVNFEWFFVQLWRARLHSRDQSILSLWLTRFRATRRSR